MIRVYGTFAGENDKRRCRLMWRRRRLSKLPERFVSIAGAYAVKRVAVRAGASINAYRRGRSVVRAKVFVLETAWTRPGELRHPLVAPLHPSSDGYPWWAAIRRLARTIDDGLERDRWAGSSRGRAGRRGRLWGGGGEGGYASRDILECVAPSLNRSARCTPSVSSAALLPVYRS